jgi:hypothetical protein
VIAAHIAKLPGLLKQMGNCSPKKGDARRIAANIAKLPKLSRHKEG